MILVLKRMSAERLVEKMQETAKTKEFLSRLRSSVRNLGASEVNIDISNLDDAGINDLETIAREANDRSIVNQIGTMRRILEQPGEAKVARLAHVETAITEWILQGVIDGWIYERMKDGTYQPWIIESVKTELRPSHGDPAIRVWLSANVPSFKGDDGKPWRSSIVIMNGDLPDTIAQILANKGYVHETPDLKTDHDRAMARFAEILAQPNAQFRIKPGTYQRAGVRIYSDRTHVIAAPRRAINDEEMVDRPVKAEASRISWDDRIQERAKRERDTMREIPDAAFTRTPSHSLHLLFDLAAHIHVWVHSDMLVEYVYQPEKTELIVLPETHRELVDILTNDIDVLEDDVVENKSGGVNILLEGEPGLGKTLLAEVYTERMKVPLYSVQAGQLGTTPESVAQGLVQIYANAARWKAVILIDEADVYIRKRNDDIHHNAIVATILVQMERSTSMTFLTTNRRGDVDDAIVSRCLAVVHFDMPGIEASRAIWRIQARTLNIEIADKDIDEIVQRHGGEHGQKASGRDIRALLKLAKRYHAARGRKVDADLLTALGAFKGM